MSVYLAATADKSMKLEVSAPPTVVKDFWVSNKYFDDNYLQQMGIFLSYMLLNVTPKSLDFQLELLKPYLAPDAYSQEEVNINLKKKKYEQYQITTSFTPNRVYTPKDKSKCRIEVEGYLSKRIGAKSLPDKSGKLTLDCININGRFYVTSISDNF
jgi:conjugal transfer pilus assembly protein TraE